MPLRIKCPSGHSLIVSESRAGQAFRCPKCQGEVRVPGEAVKPLPPITARPTEEKLAAAKPPVLEKKPIVKPPAAKQPPVPLPPLPSIPVTLVSEGIEFKEIEPPPVVLRVPQVADDEPTNPLSAARQVPPPAHRRCLRVRCRTVAAAIHHEYCPPHGVAAHGPATSTSRAAAARTHQAPPAARTDRVPADSVYALGAVIPEWNVGIGHCGWGGFR